MEELVGDPLVVADHLGDDEAEELLGENRVEPGVRPPLCQAAALLLHTLRIRRRHRVHGFESADLLRAAETLRKNVDEGGVEVVNRSAMPLQKLTRFVV